MEVFFGGAFSFLLITGTAALGGAATATFSEAAAFLAFALLLFEDFFDPFVLTPELAFPLEAVAAVRKLSGCLPFSSMLRLSLDRGGRGMLDCIFREKEARGRGCGTDGGCSDGTIESSSASEAGLKLTAAAPPLSAAALAVVAAADMANAPAPAKDCILTPVGCCSLSVCSISDTSVPDCAPAAPLSAADEECLCSLVLALLTISSNDATLPGLTRTNKHKQHMHREIRR